MTVSSLPPYIVVSTHQGSGAASSAGELRPSTDRSQVFERTKLVGTVGRLQTTLAQVLGKCKSVCTCLPFAFLPLGFLPRCVELPEPEQVSVDTPVIEFPRSFCKGVKRSRRPQEDTLQPDGKGFDGFCRCAGLGVNFDDMGGVSGTVVFGEAGHRTLLQLFDPLDLSLEAIADVDSETWVFGVEDISLGASLKGVGVGLDKVLESVDAGVELPYLSRVIVLSLFDRFEQRFGNPLQGVRVEIGAAVKDVSG